MRAPQIGRHKDTVNHGHDTQSGEPLLLPFDHERWKRVIAGLKSGKRQHNKINRERLWNRNPHCYWCGIKTVQPPETLRRLSHFHATLDHVYGRDSDKRDIIVLACFACNAMRSKYENTPEMRRFRDPERRANTLQRMKELAEMNGKE